jgi:hypothetical protein
VRWRLQQQWYFERSCQKRAFSLNKLSQMERRS